MLSYLTAQRQKYFWHKPHPQLYSALCWRDGRDTTIAIIKYLISHNAAAEAKTMDSRILKSKNTSIYKTTRHLPAPVYVECSELQTELGGNWGVPQVLCKTPAALSLLVCYLHVQLLCQIRRAGAKVVYSPIRTVVMFNRLSPAEGSGPLAAVYRCGGWWVFLVWERWSVPSSASKRSIQRFVITEKAPTRAFFWLKAATTAFTFKTLFKTLC